MTLDANDIVQIQQIIATPIIAEISSLRTDIKSIHTPANCWALSEVRADVVRVESNLTEVSGTVSIIGKNAAKLDGKMVVLGIIGISIVALVSSIITLLVGKAIGR